MRSLSKNSFYFETWPKLKWNYTYWHSVQTRYFFCFNMYNLNRIIKVATSTFQTYEPWTIGAAPSVIISAFPCMVNHRSTNPSFSATPVIAISCTTTDDLTPPQFGIMLSWFYQCLAIGRLGLIFLPIITLATSENADDFESTPLPRSLSHFQTHSQFHLFPLFQLQMQTQSWTQFFVTVTITVTITITDKLHTLEKFLVYFRGGRILPGLSPILWGNYCTYHKWDRGQRQWQFRGGGWGWVCDEAEGNSEFE